MYDSRSQQYQCELGIEHPRTRSARALFGDGHNESLLDVALYEFSRKNDDYDDASDALGVVGQVSDLWRKIVKLKANTIDLKELNGENRWQLARDIFGHALLLMFYLGPEPKPVNLYGDSFKDLVKNMRDAGMSTGGIKELVDRVVASVDYEEASKEEHTENRPVSQDNPFEDV